MKRPPGIWILLSAGVLWLSLQDVYGIRATALIFAKSTTTTPPSPVANATDGLLDSEVVTESSSESSSNVTKPQLTGNPQIDYLLDPNLPKELNGYNLSDYPFYERVPDPEEIDFKCDGLHDGFYASIPFKCQVYHHCLFGTRYDFLCANYTAFDQKTFICQFVSDVDCVGSKKFWHRNDALYKAATTTTSKPLNIYTSAPVDTSPQKSLGSPRAGGKRRRPIQRRPQYDYYDYDYDEDYYEDRPRSRRRRPRPRPRPVYEDEYEDDYEEERRNRRPYNRRGGGDRRRNKNRNKSRDEVEDDEDERPNRKKVEEQDDRPNRKKTAEEEDDRPSRKKIADEEDERPRKKTDEVEKRKPNREEDERRKPTRGEQHDDKEERNNKRKPIRDEFEDDYDARPSRPRKGSRRPILDDYEDEPNERNRPRKKNEEEEEAKPLVKPTTGTIYDRPRVAPRIKPPVPKNEADKYAYKPITRSTTSAPLDEEYYDDYEEQPKIYKIKDPIRPKSSENKERKQISTPRSRTKLDDEDDALTLTQKTRNRGRPQFKPLKEPEEEDAPRKIERERKNPKIEEEDSRVEYYDDYEIEKMPEIRVKTSTTEASKKKWKPNSNPVTTAKTTTRSTTRTTTTTTTTTAAPQIYKERPTEQIVRIVKRPFLPSRGGNPYNSRGLQPVGVKASKIEVMEQQSSIDVQKTENYKVTTLKPKGNFAKFEEAQDNAPSQTKSRQKLNKPIQEEPQYDRFPQETPAQPKPVVEETEPQIKPLRFEPQTKYSDPITDNEEDFKPMKRPQYILRPNYENGFNGPRTTQKPKIPERNPLDINENEYDVTLNDALNPTLPNLPIRSNPSYPSGFSPANDYTFSAFQRPRYVLEPNTDYTYKQPVIRQRFEAVGTPQSYNSRDQYVAPSSDYKTYYTPSSGLKRGETSSSYFTSF